MYEQVIGIRIQRVLTSSTADVAALPLSKGNRRGVFVALGVRDLDVVVLADVGLVRDLLVSAGRHASGADERGRGRGETSEQQ